MKFKGIVENLDTRKLTCIDIQHAQILYYQICELVGSMFTVHIGRSVYFSNPVNETPLDNIKHKEIEKYKIDAMAFEDSVTEEDLEYLMSYFK